MPGADAAGFTAQSEVRPWVSSIGWSEHVFFSLVGFEGKVNDYWKCVSFLQGA